MSWCTQCGTSGWCTHSIGARPEHPDTIALRECRAELERVREAHSAAHEVQRKRCESARAERDTALAELELTRVERDAARLEPSRSRLRAGVTSKTLKQIATDRDTALRKVKELEAKLDACAFAVQKARTGAGNNPHWNGWEAILKALR